MATNVIYQYGNQAGPVSKFQAFIGLRIAETSATAYRLEYNHAIWACSGANFEGTTVKYEYWLNGSRISASSVKLYGSGWYADNGWNNLGWYNIGSSVSIGTWVGYTGGSGTSYSSTSDGSYSVPGYYLDVNGLLDGSEVGNTAGYGTFNVAVNGSTVSSNVTDFYAAYTSGSSYSISNIKATTGHTYNGVSSGSLSGTISGATSVRLNFTTSIHTITYDANGGSNAPDIQTYTYASSGTTSLSENIPTRDGYEFLGWSTSSAANQAEYSAGGSWDLSIDSDTTLYAVWVKVEYCTLIYDANGGFGDIADQMHIKGVASILSSDKPIRDGYSFSGWALDSFANKARYLVGGRYTDDDFEDKSTITLYAVWRKIVNLKFKLPEEN